MAGHTQSTVLTLSPSFPRALLGMGIAIVALSGVTGTYLYRRKIRVKRVKP